MPVKKKPSKFSRLKKKVKALKRKGVSREERRLRLFRKSLEEYVEREKIEGELEGHLVRLADESVDGRFLAASCLGDLGDKRAVLPLISALKDVDVDVRWRTVEALGKLGDRRAVLPLVSALKDVEPLVRKNAVVSLGKLKDKRAVLPLVSALKDTNDVVRMHASVALGDLSFSLVSSKEKKALMEVRVLFHSLPASGRSLLLVYLALNPRELSRGKAYWIGLRDGLQDRSIDEIVKILKLDELAKEKKKGKKK